MTSRRPFRPANRPFHPRSMGNVELPQNLALAGPTLLEDFETAAQWSVSGGTPSCAANTTQFKTGSQSMKLTTTAGTTTSTMQKTVNWDLSNLESLYLWFYVHSPLADYGTSVQIHLSETANFSAYWRGYLSQTLFYSGWNCLNLSKSMFAAAAGSPNWANPILRFRLYAGGTSGKTVEVSFDSLYLVKRAPAVMLFLDDGYSAQIPALNVLTAHRMRANWGIISDLVGSGDMASLADLAAADAVGHALLNHSKDNTSLTTLSEADQETYLAACRTALNGWGLSRCSSHVIYPGGNYNADTLTAMTNLGMLTGRTIASPLAAGARRVTLPYDDLRLLKCQAITTATSLATARGYVDTAITEQMVLPLYFHKLDGSGTEWPLATFQQFVDYIVTKRDSIHCLTVDDFYRLQSGAISVPKIQ